MSMFNKDESFSVNLETFLAHLDGVDAEMAVILRANAELLTTLVRNGERNAQARIDFNTAIGQALDDFIKPAPTEERG